MWTNTDYITAAECIITASLDNPPARWGRRVNEYIESNFCDTPAEGTPDPSILLNAVEGLLVQFA